MKLLKQLLKIFAKEENPPFRVLDGTKVKTSLKNNNQWTTIKK